MDKIVQKSALGIDIGSRTAKLVLIKNNEIVFSEILDTGVNPLITANKLLSKMNTEYDIPSQTPIYSTGYGRKILKSAQKAISEISCHAKGVHYLFPEAKTIIDIGGQDSKIILLEENGKVVDFVMNDKCAAGTGRFLEVAADILELTVKDLGPVSLKTDKSISINSTCVVFAESEIIGLIAKQKELPLIVAGIHNSIAHRIKSLITQLSWKNPVVFTGGVAKNIGMRKAISQALQCELLIPENSSITGALGAALIAFKENR